jgi:hypothetical protein
MDLWFSGITTRLHRADGRFDSSQVHLFRAKQLKVYMDCLPVCCMKNDEHTFDDRLRDILAIAKKIERLTQDTHSQKDSEVNGHD